MSVVWEMVWLKDSQMRSFLLLIWLFMVDRSVVSGAFTQSLDSDFTFTLPAGQKECFFQTMKKDASLEIEYQVTYLKLLFFSFRLKHFTFFIAGIN